MGNVLYNILLHIDKYLNMNEDKIILYFDRDIDIKLKSILSRSKFKYKVLKYTNYLVWEQIILPREVNYDKVDVFWHPYNTGSIKINCIQIVSIHDVMFMKSRTELPYSRNLYQIFGRIYRKFNTPLIAMQAKTIITISNHAKEDIIKEIGGEITEKINIVYNGCDKDIENVRDFIKWKEFKNKNCIHDEFFLCLGAAEPRKNTMYTIEVFSKFINKHNLNTQLVVCGYKEWEQSDAYIKVKELNMENNVIFLDYVSDDILEMLYINALIFLFFSYYEGFGLPILEAMAFNTPVITTGVTSMPEIAGDAAIITSHNNINKTIEDIENLYYNKDLCLSLQRKGIERAKLFTWEITASNVAKIIKATCKNK